MSKRVLGLLELTGKRNSLFREYTRTKAGKTAIVTLCGMALKLAAVEAEIADVMVAGATRGYFVIAVGISGGTPKQNYR